MSLLTTFTTARRPLSAVRSLVAGATTATLAACGGDSDAVTPFPTSGTGQSAEASTGAGGNAGNTVGAGGNVAASGSGGSTASGSMVCMPNSEAACYDGPAATENVGPCMSGKKLCNEDGMAFGACEGQVLPAAEVCGNMLDENCDGKVDACEGNYVWAKGYGDSNVQAANSVALDSTGNIFVTGVFRGTLDMGKGPMTGAGVMTDDVFLAKLDAAGATLWSMGFGDQTNQAGFGVATDSSGNVVVVGRFEGGINFGSGALNSAGTTDVFVAKFDGTGKLLWAKRYGAAGADQARAVAVDAMGNIHLTGSFTTSIDFGGGAIKPVSGGGNDLFVAKLDANGNHIWSRPFGDNKSQVGNGLAVDLKGNVVVTGSFSGTMTLPPSMLPSIAASSTSVPDVFLLLLDSNGAPLFGAKFGDIAEQNGRAVAVDSKGDIYLVADGAGTTNFGSGPLPTFGQMDGMVAKFSGWDGVKTPAALWSQHFGDSLNQYCTSVSVDEDDNLVVAGGAEGTTNFGGKPLTSAGTKDAYAAKFNSQGMHVWSKLFGNNLDQVTNGVVATTTGVVLAGGFRGTIDFGGGVINNADPTQPVDDLFVAQLSP